MKIIEVIREAILKRKCFAHGQTASFEELTEEYLELLREEEKRLRAEGFSDVEIAEKLINSRIDDTDEIY